MFWSFLSFFFFSPNWNFNQEFTRKFERQYLVLKWDKIQLDIFSMVKKVLERACQLTPPCGIAHSPQSNTTIFNDGSIFFFSKSGVNETKCWHLPKYSEIQSYSMMVVFIKKKSRFVSTKSIDIWNSSFMDLCINLAFTERYLASVRDHPYVLCMLVIWCWNGIQILLKWFPKCWRLIGVLIVNRLVIIILSNLMMYFLLST